MANMMNTNLCLKRGSTGPMLAEILKQWKDDPEFMNNITRWEIIPAEEGTFSDYPDFLEGELIAALQRRGIEKLYSHQAAALEAVAKGDHTVVVTPTASGKTLCYNLPVVSAMLKEPSSRALYLFPTKALSQDQVAELRDLTAGLQTTLNCQTYDGDTEPGLRQGIRRSGHIVVTNPDMLLLMRYTSIVAFLAATWPMLFAV